MTLKTQHAASQIQGAPSKPYLSKMAHSNNCPKYFVNIDGRLKIDIDHPDWLALIEKRLYEIRAGSMKGKSADQKLKDIAKKNKKRKKNPVKEDPQEEELDEDNIIRKSIYAKAKQEILKAEQLEYKNQQERLKLKKESMNLIEYQFAEYAFFSFMERSNQALLRMVKKLKPKIVNYCMENEPENILKLMQQEIELTIKTTKDDQKKALTSWMAENAKS